MIGFPTPPHWSIGMSQRPAERAEPRGRRLDTLVPVRCAAATLACTIGCVVAIACQTPAGGPETAAEPDPMGYRFAAVRRPIETDEAKRLSEQYPEFFAVLATDYASEDADVRVVRADLVRDPSNLRSYDALNATAVVFFELHARAERSRGESSATGAFLGTSFRATKVMAVPWRAYADVGDAQLRCAIVDFFEDLLLGRKPGMRASRGRFTATVQSLLRWETDPEIRARIESLVARASASGPAAR
jgi:hypothetical protein